MTHTSFSVLIHFFKSYNIILHINLLCCFAFILLILKSSRPLSLEEDSGRTPGAGRRQRILLSPDPLLCFSFFPLFFLLFFFPSCLPLPRPLTKIGQNFCAYLYFSTHNFGMVRIARKIFKVRRVLFMSTVLSSSRGSVIYKVHSDPPPIEPKKSAFIDPWAAHCWHVSVTSVSPIYAKSCLEPSVS